MDVKSFARTIKRTSFGKADGIIRAYSDSAGCIRTRRSTSGGVYCIGGCTAICRSMAMYVAPPGRSAKLRA